MFNSKKILLIGTIIFIYSKFYNNRMRNDYNYFASDEDDECTEPTTDNFEHQDDSSAIDVSVIL